MTQRSGLYLKARRLSRYAVLTPIVLIFFLADSVWAQAHPEPLSFYAGVGLGDSWADEHRNGLGVKVLGGIELRLFHGIGVRLDASATGHRRSFESGVRFEGSDAIASASVVGRFGNRRVQPYLLAGISYVHSERRSEFPIRDFSFIPTSGDLRAPVVGHDVSEYSMSDLGPSFGGGADIFLYERVFLRAETRLYTSESLKLAIGGSLGVTYRW